MFASKSSPFLTVGIITLLAAGGTFGLTRLLHQDYQNVKAGLQGKSSATIHNVALNRNLDNIPTEFQSKIIYQAKLPTSQKAIALTFDDGPGPKYTAQVLEILKKNNIKATFFLLGQMVSLHPQIAKQIAADGHVLGNHTWHHWYRRMDVATAASEINRTTDIIYKTTGVKTTLFRPPGGFLHNGLVDYAKTQKYAIIMWSDESGDSQRRGQSASLIKNVEKSAKPGGIVLMHDGGGNRSRTVKALPQIIADLKAKGYKFVTIPELLEMQIQAKNVVTAESSMVTNNKYSNHK